jgi:four helix bundle protein
MSLDGLEKLDVWRKARDFVGYVYREAIQIMPAEEKWALCHQMRRSVQSIPANIAEGYGRYYFQENVRFCYIARGSLEETISHLVIAHDLGYLPDQVYQKLVDEGENLDKLINGYIGYLKRSRTGIHEPGSPHSLHDEVETYLPEIDLD